MIYYYGNEVCTGCKITKMMLDKTNIPYQYVDVATIPGFEGEIPQLQLYDGALLIGNHEIRQWIRESGYY